MNRYLPNDIAVIGAAFVPDSFHPRYGALGKEYVYRILDGAVENPFLYGRVWRIPYNFSDDMLRTMSELASCFVGKHDFHAFMSAGSSVSSTSVPCRRHPWCGEAIHLSNSTLKRTDSFTIW